MKILRGVKSQLVKIFVIAFAVREIIELNFFGVLSENLNIYFIPRIVVGRSRICEKRGDNTVVFFRVNGRRI